MRIVCNTQSKAQTSDTSVLPDSCFSDAVDLEHKAVQVICLGAVHGVWPDQPWAPPNCSQTFLCYVMDKIRTHLKTVAKRALLEKLRQSYLEDLAHP